MPCARFWEDSTAGEDADSHGVPPALSNTPPPLQQWCLKSCVLPRNTPVSQGRPHNLCLAGHRPLQRVNR